MARRRFFVDSIRNGRAELTGEEARHLTRVLRVEPGQHYEISDNRHAWVAEVESARKEHIIFRMLEALDPESDGVRVTLLASMIKFDRYELLLEKATELGVSVIVPVQTARSERGLEHAAPKRIERWRKIAMEASQQSRRSHLPEIEEPVEFKAAIDRKAAARLFLDEARDGTPLLKALPDARTAEDTVAVLTGPEGGWTDAEREAAIAAGWRQVSLGRRILRAETAAIAALALIQAAWQIE